jgi:hypothetical protein
MRAVVPSVFLVGLLVLFAAAGYGLWACADPVARCLWYCRVLESVKPFTELISVILAFFGFLFGTIFSKNLAHEKETRALARAFAAEIGYIDIHIKQCVEEIRRLEARKCKTVHASSLLSFKISETPVHNRAAHRIGQFPAEITNRINIFYWWLKFEEDAMSAMIVREKDTQDSELYNIEVIHPNIWTELQPKATELSKLLLDFANTPLPPWWKLVWLS